MSTLNELFAYADIDDVSQGPEGTVILEFTTRDETRTHIVEGIDLDEAVELARMSIARDLVVARLHREGLTDADIDRLTDAEFDAEVEAQAWDRGYEAAISDVARAEVAAREAIASVNPAMATAGEPYEALSSVDDGVHLEHMPLLTVIYQPVAIARHD